MIALIKWLPFLAKFAGIAKWFTWLPGGSVLGIIGGLFGLIVSFFRWLVRDIEDAFKEPPRIVVRLVFGLVMLGVGVHQGIKWDADKVAAAHRRVQLADDQTERWRVAHQQLLDKAKTIDQDDKQKHQKALAAKLKAEADERAKIEAEQKAEKQTADRPGLVADHTAKQPADEPAVRVREGAAARKAARCKKRGGESLLFGLQPVWGGALACKAI